MAKRYYLCDILGDGSDEEPFRAAVADHGVNHVAVFPPQLPNGQYSRPHCLVLVNAPSHAVLRSDQKVDAMPDFPLDGKVASVEANAKEQAIAAMQRRGFASDFNNKDGYREVIRSIGRELQADFDENNFDVSE